ncbi:hypothetical protein X743_30355 [Mesorhizobium sp. LNHC252B00]|uniref:hypothetical protein n=1 Tax=Mesorhizobium sp. LNHC252B00 TaxID=1287252 RepID=UPI0003CE5720|nr:hypothetical protein [Mesorhizobium sp. LNHC252B00]ESY64964.1 hypothetical protein X743_30355 [Mesorhizobium sp. LNHC252B00]
MLKAITEFARAHILGTVVASITAGAAGGAGVYWSLYEARVNRIEEMKVQDFQGLVAENKKFEELLSAFTEEVGTSGAVDPAKRKEISASLVRLYSGLGAFTVNLPPEQELPVKKPQTSINEVKKHVQLMQKKQDMETLGAALAVMFQDMKAAQPVLEQAVGKQFASAT